MTASLVDHDPFRGGSVTGARLHGVRRIAVLRAGGLGDLMFAVPAMRAVAAAYPEAEVTLLGSPLAASLLRDRPGAPHRIDELPEVPGIVAPPSLAGEAPSPAVEAFVAEHRDRGYDLAMQLHGGGRFSNPFLLRLEAACTIGTRTPDAAQLDRSIEYVYYQHEVMRWLEVAGLAGAAPAEVEPVVAVRDEELRLAADRFGTDLPLVAVHPGATDPRRRWPAERYAELAAALANDGARVVLVGQGRDEKELCARVASLARDRLVGGRERAGLVHDASGALTIAELVGVLALAEVVVGNDSGPRHLAQALGTATASIFWCGNLLNAGPFGRGRHRVQISWTTACPVCGVDCTTVDGSVERCEHDPSFVGDVPTAAVLADVRALLA